MVNVSLPARRDEIVSSWRGRNDVYPQYFLRTAAIVFDC